MQGVDGGWDLQEGVRDGLITLPRSFSDGDADGLARAVLQSCARRSPVPPLSRDPGDAPGTEDAILVHGGCRHRCHLPTGLPAHGVPAWREVMEVAKQGDAGQGLPGLLHINGHQDGELGLRGI